MSLFLQFIYFSVSFISSFCIFQNKNLDNCSYFVGIICIMDIILHLFEFYTIRISMLYHHIFSLCIILFLYNHIYPVTYNIENKNILIKNVLLTEISTMFLILNNIIKNNKSIYCKIINKINQIIFIITFVYSRIYNYFINIIINKEVNYFIINVTKSNIHLIYMYIGIYGLFTLNIYWFYLIIKKYIKL
jgi:hypothetical protein